MLKLYVGWQEPRTRRWYTVGRLASRENDGLYEFIYTKGAENALETGKFLPFSRMKDLKKRYLSEELFPLFSNRILPKSRPDYKDYLKWMDLSEKDASPLKILARSGGERATDLLQVYPAPEKTDDGKYKTYFFVRGLRYLAAPVFELCSDIKVGHQLFPMHDFANHHDKYAVSLRTDDPAFMIGYCPRYLSEDLLSLAKNDSKSLKITVNRVNETAPLQMRFRCEVVANWPQKFESYTQKECEPLILD